MRRDEYFDTYATLMLEKIWFYQCEKKSFKRIRQKLDGISNIYDRMSLIFGSLSLYEEKVSFCMRADRREDSVKCRREVILSYFRVSAGCWKDFGKSSIFFCPIFYLFLWEELLFCGKSQKCQLSNGMIPIYQLWTLKWRGLIRR